MTTTNSLLGLVAIERLWNALLLWPVPTLAGTRASSRGETHDVNKGMMTRKVWVKRPGGSATLIPIDEDDLVDDVRERILRKYANSLGRQFDAPDLVLRVRKDRRLPELNRVSGKSALHLRYMRLAETVV